MLKEYIKNKQKTYKDFYTKSGIKVFINTKIEFDIDIQKAIAYVENKIPSVLRSEIEMILIGDLKDFDEREISAFYEDGCIYIDPRSIEAGLDMLDLVEQVIHEIAHSVGGAYGELIYGDSEIQNEFLRKRKYLHDILWKMGHKTQENFFLDLDYSEEFDNYIHDTVGYNKLHGVLVGIFLFPYAVTSLREYFATGFSEYFMNPDDHGFFKQTCPVLYKKIRLLHELE